LVRSLRASALAVIAVSIVACFVVLSLRAQAPDRSEDLTGTLARIGEHVAQYYARARRVICIETVVLQPVTSTWSFEGPSRELKYELRVEWEPVPSGEPTREARVVRQLLAIGGRPPRAKDEPGCTDPKTVSPEPLALLLPGRREDYTFKWGGTSRSDGRRIVMLDYRSIGAQPADIVWKDDCVTIDLPGHAEGRVWADAATDEVLRLDEHLIGMFEFRVPREHSLGGRVTSMVVERADSSIRYRPVPFHDPDETIMLPASIVTTTAIRGVSVQRLRTTQTFSKYKRFVTGGRIVGER
jgi:hypothetical protein